MSTWKSARISAFSGVGRSPSTEPLSQGERVETFGSSRSARTSCGPCSSSAAAGPRSRIANGAEGPKCSSSIALASAEALPGTSSVVGSSFESTPVPITARAARTIAAISRISRGWRSSQGARGSPSEPRGRLLPLPLLLPTRGSLALRGYGRSEPMRKNVLRTAILTVVALLAMGGVALAAIVLRAGPVEVVGRRRLHADDAAEARRRRRSRCTAKAASAPPTAALPPILKTLTVWYDKHGAVVTKGLPYCTKGKLEATTSATARKVCAGSIVGEGHGTALIAFPEQRPFKASSPITIFNAAAAQRQPDRARPRLPQRARADHLHRPGGNPEGERRAVRVPHRSGDPEDRRRRRDPAGRLR